MRTFLLASLSTLACGLLTAQAPVVTMRAPAMISCFSQAGSSWVLDSLPAGPLPASGAISALAGISTSTCVTENAWHSGASATHAWCSLRQSMVANMSGSCVAGPNDFVFGVACPVQRPVFLSIQTDRGATPGLPSTTVEIDIGNDGTVDYSGELLLPGISVSAAIGPQPLEVRVRFAGGFAVGLSGQAEDRVDLEVTPDNQLLILPAASGCVTYSASLQPAWDNTGILLDVGLPGSFPPIAVAVLGLSPQPVLLPHTPTLLPCLLLPSPDLVVVLPPGGLALPLPPAVRPITLFAQFALLDFGGIGTSNGFVVAG